MNAAGAIKEKTAHVFDVHAVRKDFPILHQLVYGSKPLVYFDNAASSQKPNLVIDAISDYYSGYNANVHRGVHFLSQKASNAYDEARLKVRDFIGAASGKEIVFTKGTTESINLVAATYGRKNISSGDEIIVTGMEHHSNIVPWQLLCEEKGAVLKVIPLTDDGELEPGAFEHLLSSKTKFISVTWISNSLGTINPVKEIIDRAHRQGIPVMLDGAQAAAHIPIDVKSLDCDFFAFSGHKMLGPTGIGVLYGKLNLLESMPPYMGGGEMIQRVTFEKTTYNEVPFKFEAGTPHIEGVIGLGAAIDYWNSLDREAALQHEHRLLQYATSRLSEIPEVHFYGTSKNKAAVISFTLEGINAMDAGMYLDTQGIAVRTGQHCTEPVMDRYCIPGTIRASFMFYNTKEEIDSLVEAVKKAVQLLK